MPTLVSIHDVSPAWRDEVDAALRLCAEAGATPALLVVPDWHGAAPLLDDPPLCARLRELQARGHEVYLHGWRHEAGPAPPVDVAPTAAGRLRWMFAQRVV